jgi:hypothetical protein
MRWSVRITMIVLLLLSAATLLDWAFSFRRSDSLAWSRWWPSNQQYNGVTYDLTTGRGVIGLTINRMSAFPAASGARAASQWRHRSGNAESFDLPLDTRWRRIGFGHIDPLQAQVRGVGGASVSFTIYWVPHWFVATVFALPPAIFLILSHPLRKRQRRRAGQCVRCGYDLRASTNRCPECGTPIPVTGTTP